MLARKRQNKEINSQKRVDVEAIIIFSISLVIILFLCYRILRG